VKPDINSVEAHPQPSHKGGILEMVGWWVVVQSYGFGFCLVSCVMCSGFVCKIWVLGTGFYTPSKTVVLSTLFAARDSISFLALLSKEETIKQCRFHLVAHLMDCSPGTTMNL